MMKMIQWIMSHRQLLIKGIFSLSIAFLISFGVIMHKQNKKLSDRLETAQNNIEAYQGLLSDSQQACGVLQLTVNDLKNSKDSLINELAQQAKKNNIKPSTITAAATQTQQIIVNQTREIVRDTIFSDSIKYNDLTTVYYTIGLDTINIGLDISNTQYLYTIKRKEFKNKKKFLKRLFTLDFKKVWKHEYSITNTNDLIKTSDVRVIELN